MSLAFLAKKSFNPANLKNAEKVWIAEQQHKEEQKRLAELKKQIQEERQQQELRDLQRASGHGGGKPVREKVDWMYSAPMATCEATSDEYLLGKAAGPEQLGGSGGAQQGEVRKLENKQLAGAKAAVRAVDDTFQRLHEDPLLAMRQREMEARQRVLSNPHQMHQLRRQAEQERGAAAEDRKRSRRELKKQRKRHKKERKKEKKAQKKERKRQRKRQRREGKEAGELSDSDSDSVSDSSDASSGSASDHTSGSNNSSDNASDTG